MGNVNKKNTRRKAAGWDNAWREGKHCTTLVLDKELADQVKQFLADKAKPGNRQSFNGLVEQLLATYMVKNGYRNPA